MARTKKEIADNSIEEENVTEIESKHKYSDVLSSTGRDSYGLLENVEYQFNIDGSVNWRGMIQKEYLVPNRDLFRNKNINIKEIDVSTLPDNQLLILLGGIKDLAQIRGFQKVSYKVISAGPEYVAVKCTIDWIANFETNYQPVQFSALADAHLENTKDFAKNFLMAIAENRAFIRCVRNFLRINIVGNDEMGKSTHQDDLPVMQESGDASTLSNPIALLRKTMSEYGISFDQIRERAVQKNMEKAETWSSESDISPLAMFTIINGIKSKKQK
jgi:hypothetical protein